jgi:hypothetical protein
MVLHNILLLFHTNEICLGKYGHENLSFKAVVEKLQPTSQIGLGLDFVNKFFE